jgi:hypothetical protein
VKIEYKWRYDVKYYATVVDRYYQQLPFLLRLPSQFTLLWLLGIIVFSWATDEALKEYAWWALLIGAIGIPAGVVLTKLGIRLRYRLRRRSGFGSETSYSMAETGITITGTGQGTFAWSMYSRAVRFPDGILLVRKGAVRWLPDAALKSGTVEGAMALVSSQLPTRTINR